MTPIFYEERVKFDTRPERSITSSYHVEYFERGYWHTESQHVCEAHAKHRAQRFEHTENLWCDLARPVRLVKVTTAVERMVIE